MHFVLFKFHLSIGSHFAPLRPMNKRIKVGVSCGLSEVHAGHLLVYTKYLKCICAMHCYPACEFGAPGL